MAHMMLILMMTDILHDLIYQKHGNYGRKAYMGHAGLISSAVCPLSYTTIYYTYVIYTYYVRILYNLTPQQPRRSKHSTESHCQAARISKPKLRASEAFLGPGSLERCLLEGLQELPTFWSHILVFIILKDNTSSYVRIYSGLGRGFV